MKRRGVSKALLAVQKRASLPLPSLIYTIFPPKVSKNVSYFLTNQSETKTFIDLKVTKTPKPTKNTT